MIIAICDKCRALSRPLLISRITADELTIASPPPIAWNQKLEEWGKEPVNTRRVTNIGCFRAYVSQYLKHHPQIRQDLTLMSRQLAPTADGLPLEIYCFTSTIQWVEYEGIASDIFDHLLAILPEFGLRVFQHPSGIDMRELGNQRLSNATVTS